MRLRTPLVLTVLWALVYIPLAGVLAPAVAAGCGHPALDTLFSWDRATAAALWEGCTADGLLAYRRLAALDLGYPLLLAATVGAWILWFARALTAPRWLIIASLIPTLANMLSDYAENIAVNTLLRFGPADPGPWLELGGIFTAVKSISGMLGFAVAASYLLCWLLKRRRQDVGRARVGAMPG